MVDANWIADYRAALERYLQTDDEDARKHAYDAGRGLIAAGEGLLGLTQGHAEALARILAGEDDEEHCAAVTVKAAEFLAEALAPFEMALLGFREANQMLKVLNATLEERVAERTREQLALEKQMRASQRMEAVGRLAGGIAHDFNNVLTVIQAYAVFLQGRFEPDDSAREDVEIIIDASERAARLTNQLLAFSRKQVQQLVPVVLNDTVADLDRMLRRVIGEHIDLATRLDPELGTVNADVTQIEQVVLNLAVNARDAMPRGGRMTIETANIDLTETYSQPEFDPVPAGQYVMIAVSDTGHGMDEETRTKIFEPFFTTKKDGEGTGLGLATVYGIVRQHGGFIWVYSEPERGTTFKIYLPRISDDTVRHARKPGTERNLEGDETILLVEDEEYVREAAARILRRAGYTILEAQSGAEALALAESWEGAIDVVVTDVIMPGMSGETLTTRIRKVRQDIAVVYMSGYTDNAIVHQGILDPDTHFIQKPFSPDSLLSKVREALDEG